MSKPYNDKGWASHIKELKKFKEKFGHCNVRRTQKEYITLSYWIRRVRGLYKLRKAGKRTTLTDERIKELEDLGFGWEGWSANRSDVFQTRLKELQDFYKAHGHCRLPSPYPENPSLKSWANSIRQKFRQQNAGIGKSTLTQWQIDQLKAVGFEFESTAAAEGRGSHWKKHMQTLREYKETNGHFQVPLDYPENPSFAQWVANLQQEWENIQNGEGSSSFLSAPKIAELEKIGFFSRPDGYDDNPDMDEESSETSDEEPQSFEHEIEEEPVQEVPAASPSVLSQVNAVAPTNNLFAGLASLAEICRVVSQEEARNSHQQSQEPSSSGISPQQEQAKPETKKQAASAGRKRKSKEGYGHWTQAEHQAFLQGLQEFGRKWTKIASKIPSRTTSQVRSHAQKYFDKIKRDQEEAQNHQHTTPDMNPLVTGVHSEWTTPR